jgi:hypothetical protein
MLLWFSCRKNFLPFSWETIRFDGEYPVGSKTLSLGTGTAVPSVHAKILGTFTNFILITYIHLSLPGS